MSNGSQGHGPASGSPFHDVVFVGTGISNTFTLIELLDRLERQRIRSARVLLIDKHPDHFKGVPYGTRSGELGLIITRVSDFLPATQFPQFSEWLVGHRDPAFERFFALGGDRVDDWRTRYWHDVEAGVIAELYLPRYIFGLYFEHIARRAIDRAREQGVAICETVVGEVVDIGRADEQFTVVARDAHGIEQSYPTQRVVLGLGSAPSSRLLETLPAAPECVLIDDPFDPGIAHAVDRIRSAVTARPGTAGRVLIVGSNAGALDVIYNLMNDRVIAKAVGRIDVLSMSGRFPELFYAQPEGFRPTNVARSLKHLAGRDTIRAADILAAVNEDIELARHDGLTITDTFWDISAAFTTLLDRLPPDEKLEFANDTGPRIGAMQRRVGQDYWSLLDGLTREGTLVITQGRFPVDAPAGASEHGELVAIINCSGTERLDSPDLRSALIRSLLERGWVRATGSGFGIRVSDDLEVDTAGLYVIGPMLTGNVLRDDPAWNLEHCGRIALLARQLAAHLVDDAFAESAA